MTAREVKRLTDQIEAYGKSSLRKENSREILIDDGIIDASGEMISDRTKNKFKK